MPKLISFSAKELYCNPLVGVIYSTLYFVSLFLIIFGSLKVSSNLSILLFVFFFRWHIESLKPWLSKYKGGLIALSLCLLAGIIFSEMPNRSLKGFIDVFRGFIYLPLTLTLLRCFGGQLIKRGLMFALVVIFFILLVVFLYVSVDFSSWSIVDSFRHEGLKHLNWMGTIHSPANTAALYCIALLAFHPLFDRAKIAWFVSLILACAFILYSDSTGTMMALPVVVFFLLCPVRYRQHGVVFLILMISIVYGVNSYIRMYGLTDTLLDVLHLDASMSQRERLYLDSVELTKMHPFFGWGINTYKYVVRDTADAFVALFPHAAFPHNFILEIIYSLGLVVAPAFLISVVWLIASHKAHSSIYYSFGVALLLFLLLRGYTDLKVFSVYYFGIFFSALGFMWRNQEALDKGATIK